MMKWSSGPLTFFSPFESRNILLCTRSIISTTTNLQPPSEPSPTPQHDGGPSTETWRGLRPNPEYPGFTAPLASFFREERDGGGGGGFHGPLPPLEEEKGEFKRLQAETIRNAQLPSAAGAGSSESPLPRIQSNPPTAASPSTLSFSPQSRAPTLRPTASPVYYKPLPPQQSHFDKTLQDHVVRSQFGGPLLPPREEERFEPRQEDIDLDGGIEEFEGDDSDGRIPVGFDSHNGFKIPDFFRNFLSAPPVWIKDKL